MNIDNLSAKEIKNIVTKQREFFATGATLEYGFRREQLKKLLSALERWERTVKTFAESTDRMGKAIMRRVVERPAQIERGSYSYREQYCQGRDKKSSGSFEKMDASKKALHSA